jgi:hypothetical protein
VTEKSSGSYHRKKKKYIGKGGDRLVSKKSTGVPLGAQMTLVPAVL